MESNEARPVSLSEVKSILRKVEKDREELNYEQRIALEHANIFAKLPVKKTEELIKELLKIEFIQKIHAHKIADILPKNADDVKTIFAKERITLDENKIKNILDIVRKYYTE